MKIKISWPNGPTEYLEQTDAHTLEDVINAKFGSAWGTAQESGVEVAEVSDEEWEAVLRGGVEQHVREEEDDTDTGTDQTKQEAEQKPELSPEEQLAIEAAARVAANQQEIAESNQTAQ